MSQGMQNLRSRIKSTEATMKITSAMELMANAKLQKIRSDMERNREYSEVLIETLQELISSNKNIDNEYLKRNSSTKALYIIFSSDLGLCGGYNSNMLKYALSLLKEEDLIIAIGSKARSYFLARGFKVINDYISSDTLSYEEVTGLINKALELYLKNEVGSLNIVYTRFVNILSYEPENEGVLPVDAERYLSDSAGQETIFEPSAEEICSTLIPLALSSRLYSLWLETKTSEQASRRVSMEHATDNGEDLKEKLKLQYNRARQAAITQEITEIVAGAGAL